MEKENIKWKKEKEFQAESYMRFVITPAQTAIKKDILITGRCALHVLGQVAGTKSTVHRQGGSGATLSFNLIAKKAEDYLAMKI
jgi:hypothetical protein